MNPTALAYLYLSQHGGDTTKFRTGLLRGARIGKAFFDALSVHDQSVITTTTADPYYLEDPACVAIAINYLDTNR